MAPFLTRAVLVSVALVLTESILRVNAPSFSRPSTLMNSTAAFIAEWAYWLGYQAARITDLYYLIKKYIGDDVVVLIVASWKLVKAPLEAVCGYIAYYTHVPTIQWILSVFIVCALVYGINKLYPAPFVWARKQFTSKKQVLHDAAVQVGMADAVHVDEDDADESASLQPKRSRRVHS